VLDLQVVLHLLPKSARRGGGEGSTTAIEKAWENDWPTYIYFFNLKIY
jgi:hypothetical protein